MGRVKDAFIGLIDDTINLIDEKNLPNLEVEDDYGSFSVSIYNTDNGKSAEIYAGSNDLSLNYVIYDDKGKQIAGSHLPFEDTKNNDKESVFIDGMIQLIS